MKIKIILVVIVTALLYTGTGANARHSISPRKAPRPHIDNNKIVLKVRR